jgi:hypothetical protein
MCVAHRSCSNSLLDITCRYHSVFCIFSHTATGAAAAAAAATATAKTAAATAVATAADSAKVAAVEVSYKPHRGELLRETLRSGAMFPAPDSP